MVVSIQPQLPNVIRAAVEAVPFKAGQVLEALVIGKMPDGLTALKIGGVVITAQLPQTLQTGTTLQLLVKVAGPAPQLVMVGTPQIPAAATVSVAAVLPLPQVQALPTAGVSTAPSTTPVVIATVTAAAPAAVAPGATLLPTSMTSTPQSTDPSGQASPKRIIPAPPDAPHQAATPSRVALSRPVTPQAATAATQIGESQQTVAAASTRIESIAVTTPVASPSAAVPEPRGVVLAPAAQPSSQASGPSPLTVAAATNVVPAAALTPAPQLASAVPAPMQTLAESVVPSSSAQPSSPMLNAAPVTAAPVPILTEAIAPSPLLVAQALRPPPSATDMPKPLPIAASALQPQAPAPATPAAALSQMIPEALARQNSIAPLLVSLAAAVLKPGLPQPVVKAALQVLGQRLQVTAGGPTAEQLEAAVAKSGVYLEAAVAKGTVPAGDLKGGLMALKGALATWLGGNPAPVTPGHQTAPPLRGIPPRASAVDLPQLPNAPLDAARTLHGQADAALSRVKLMQLASLPDADPARASAQELRLELPLLIGHELVMAQFQVTRDAARRKTEGKRGWTMRLAMNFSATGEVGAEVGLLGRSVNVALWAADPSTAADLEAALPELAPALAALGLEPGAVRVRSLPPEVPRPTSGQYLDSRR